MSKITALVPYQFETFGRRAGQNPSHGGQDHPDSPFRQGTAPPRPDAPAATGASPLREGRRQPAFLVQMLVDGDSDLRKALGRRDLAGQRQNAYDQALSSRPSARPLSFLRLVETA